MPSRQWNLVRQYLSMTNLNVEVEKLIMKLKPASADQWENLIKRFEKAITAKFPTRASSKITAGSDIASTTDIKDSTQENTLDLKTTDLKTAIKKEDESQIRNNHNEERESKEKINPDSLTIGTDQREFTMEGLFQGLRLKKDLHFGKLSEPSWKIHKPIISKNSIHSRTAYVISAIVTAETKGSLLKRTEQFIAHLHQYPEARDYAIKEGGIRALLRVQNKLDTSEPLCYEINGVVKEALALLGYCAPSIGPGPNILSIDGGGIRGIIAIEILKHLERITGRKVHQLFDYIVGVSTGAIIAAVIGSGIGNLDTASDMYHNLSKKMFGNTSLIGGTSRLVWSHSYYDTEVWEQMLQENLKNITLTQCNRHNTPKIALVSCVVNSGSRLTPFLFRSYELPFRVRSVFPGTRAAQVWQAVRASAAAPTYFQEFKHEGALHQDGGIMVNNPAGVGLHEVRLLYGSEALQNGCLISVGTGKALHKHSDYQNMTNGFTPGKETSNSTSWKDKFNKILDSATDTEGVHVVLNDLLPSNGYFRLNPPLMEECAMDEICPDKLSQMATDTQSYIRRNKQKFESAAAMLTRKRTIRQKIEDFVKYQGHIMGVKQAH